MDDRLQKWFIVSEMALVSENKKWNDDRMGPMVHTHTKHKRQSWDSDELAIEVTVQAHSWILCRYPEPEDQRKNPQVQKGVRDTTPWNPSLEI